MLLSTNTSICWIPGHINLIDHDYVDTFAKDAAMIRSDPSLSLNSNFLPGYPDKILNDLPIATKSILLYTKSKWQDAWNNSKSGRAFYSISNSVDQLWNNQSLSIRDHALANAIRCFNIKVLEIDRQIDPQPLTKSNQVFLVK